ncbi:hypothetical protein FSP39_000197 [Pinctada imbricata]|uniref:Short-chain collagen C4-like n=1 Tax=Pinctada imbricata TaxID=66713 RepID=A0AA88XPT6_PINIB|nr:hypothetical protein FSP39_000197 [Pinctada imbricata]
MYIGYVGGSYFDHSGGAADSLCLPSENPKFIESRTTFYAFIYGAEYQVNEIKDDRASLHDHKVPCAVCTRRGKSTVKMFPAMDDCPGNFSQEYNGTLMAGAYSHPSATQYTCIDKHPEALTGAGHINQNGRLFYTVSAACGSLKCPPYKNNKELACVVCSL